ncbi:AraC family transcriptional regulator [Iodobacter sp.]|uniref:helix-turn-helix transcriptional regulator n=1 Tax=Iodobacter sp. TaxID=1915058 RepID=UPI0025CFA2E5|nr:AraC family transcriptional regulator [Iodobacter sp.]
MGKREVDFHQADLDHLFGDEAQNVPQQGALLRGRFIVEDLRPGLSLHGNEVEFLQAHDSEGPLSPGLRLIIMLEGKVDACFGSLPLELGASNRCVLVSSLEEELLKRQIAQGGYQRQVVLALEQSWFEEGGLSSMADFKSVERFCSQHLAHRTLNPDRAFLRLAEGLLQPIYDSPYLQKIHRECHSLELILFALNQLKQTVPLKARSRHRVAQLLELLQSDVAGQMSLEQMAQNLGSNTTTLQREFQAIYGVSIITWLRRHKLQEARRVLERDSCSVLDAALLAGYNSPANFATAFKREFGFTPRQVGQRFM